MENIIANKLQSISSFIKKFLFTKSDSSKGNKNIGFRDLSSFNSIHSLNSNPDDSIITKTDYSSISHPDNWIINLDANVQLALATKLINIIMPEWVSYSINKDLVYTDTMSVRYSRISGDFLQHALREIKNNASIIVLQDNIKYGHVKKCLDEFIPPVVAMNDGEWVVPYFIKKIILSVFNVLNGLEHSNKHNKVDYFYKSISLSIEVIEGCQLCPMHEMYTLLEEYRSLQKSSENSL